MEETSSVESDKVYERFAAEGHDLQPWLKWTPEPPPAVATDKPLFIQCHLWDDIAVAEWRLHEQLGYQLFSKMGLGRLFQSAIVERSADDYGIAGQMNWMQDFSLVEVRNLTLARCNDTEYLRVAEVPTAENPKAQEKLWDLFIYPNCAHILSSLSHRYLPDVRTLLAIWNAPVFPYSKPWRDEGDTVFGEVALRCPSRPTENPLTILVFRDESVHNALNRYEDVLPPGLFVDKRGIDSYYAHEDRHVAVYSQAKSMATPGEEDDASQSDDTLMEIVSETSRKSEPSASSMELCLDGNEVRLTSRHQEPGCLPKED